MKKINLDNYECDGQITIDEWLSSIKDDLKKVHPVDIKGLCDDAYCPECGFSLDEFKHKDCERCPECGIRIDWGPWHRANDEEM